MALARTGLPVTMEDMVPHVYMLGSKGTLAADMVSAARRNGGFAVRLESIEEVLGEVAAGHPVLRFQNPSLDIFPQWHLVLIFGYDLERRTLIFHSGRDKHRITALDVFEHTWVRTGHWGQWSCCPRRR